ncbi:unnamed protein product [Cladocopium goreaui]|uniref:K Homology domain-containing protein n=1 Tax=Cladocopium goreaui TaxID=2562237 RepID=A0A9P1D2G5_9DINO|nr:unnamed protein product [Cladocopium goreaui]
MITLEPGDVPCYMLLEQLQAISHRKGHDFGVPRVIGKAGAIIKELRQALQRSYHVAFAKSSEPRALQSAVLGLVRNARGPMALKSLGAEGQDVAFLVPAKCEAYLQDQLLAETKCSMQVEIIEGLRKHRKVTLRAEETHELQAVAWRLQEMGELQLRMCQGALLTERDFDLQDTAWDDVMEAFRSKRVNRAQAAEAPEAAVPLEKLPTLTASSDVEAEARKARQLEQRDLEAQKEKERKKQLRETAAREQQECQTAAREAKMFADKARELRLRAAEAQSMEQQSSCLQEAECYEEQARQAKGRSTRGYGIGPRAQQHEYQAAEPTDGSALSAAPPSGEELRRQAEREEQIRQRKLRDQQAREKEQRERVALHQAFSGASRTPAQPPQPAPAQVPAQAPAQPPLPPAEEWPPPQPQRPAASQGPPEAVNTRPSRPSAAVKATNHQLDPAVHPSPAAFSGDVADVALLVKAPDWKAAEYLASSRLGIGRRTGTKLSVDSSFGFPLLQIRGTPVANALASYLAQEALWMNGSFK